MTPRRTLATVLLAFAAVGVLPMSSAYACSCVAEPGQGGTLEGNTVFSGTVTRREGDFRKAVFHVVVDRVYSGSVGPAAQVHTSGSGASCGLEIPAAGPAVFYAREEDGVLQAGLCDGTYAGPPRADLGEGRAPDPTKTVAPTPSAAPPADSPDATNAVPVAAAFAAVAGARLLVRRRSLRQ